MMVGALISSTTKKYATRKPNVPHPWACFQINTMVFVIIPCFFVITTCFFVPYRMVIVGAGYIACEQACIFNNFGTEVHMLYMEEVALGGELAPSNNNYSIK